MHSVVRNLAVWLAKILNPLVKQFVPAHIASSQDFIESIKDIHLNNSINFGSLDVTNLYGTIPLEDSDSHCGLISVLGDFWKEHKSHSLFPDLQDEDFISLVRLCLFEDCYYHAGNFKKQTTGIAMGNNAAPPFAIIFMNHVESAILANNSNSIFLWKRYIDDVFFVTSLAFDEILQISNSITASIKFTIEQPVDNEIPFLDLSVIRCGPKFQYKIYIKNSHSNTCLPFDSFVPNNRKMNLITAETRRAVERSSNDQHRAESVAKIQSRFSLNKYPPQIIRKHTFKTNSDNSTKSEPINYLKVPYKERNHSAASSNQSFEFYPPCVYE